MNDDDAIMKKHEHRTTEATQQVMLSSYIKG